MQLSPSLASALRSGACAEITASHSAALAEIARKNVHPSQKEARFVAHLCRSMSGVATAWGRAMAAARPGWTLRMSTVFTHQTPCVTFEGGRCELADVLIVMVDDSVGTPSGVAMLVQAKLSPTARLSLSQPWEKMQFLLLSTRPTFDVDDKSAPSGIRLSDLCPDVALMYGITNSGPGALSASFASAHHWLTAKNLRSVAGTNVVTGKDCLAYTIVGMLLGRSGWRFDLPPKGKDWTHFAAAESRDDWSELVNYLLEQKFSRPLPSKLQEATARKNSGGDHVVCLTTANPVRRSMFFISQGTGDSLLGHYSGNEENVGTGEWREVRSDDVLLDGDMGDSSDGVAQGPDEEPSEGGPISAILFEFNRG